MDSLTQFVLGAVVSTACLGKSIGPRKAAVVGGLLGTLPDLDVFIPFDDPVDAFVLHRGWTHSLFTHAIAAPIIGECLMRLVRGLRDHRAMVWLTVFLCLSTHALIDAMTIYGTRIFWPFSNDPVGVGSVFIIDPVYTLPLLGVTIWALIKRDWTERLRRGLIAALVFSTGYLGLSMVLQSHMETRAREIFAQAGIQPDRVLALAGPFNTVLWKVIGLEEDSYHNLYLSLLDEPASEGTQVARIYTHPRRPDLTACLDDSDALAKLEWFSRGYFKAEELDGKLIVSDLRMGMTPAYVFRFALAEHAETGVKVIAPERSMTHRTISGDDGSWLIDRLKGLDIERKSERLVVREENQVEMIASC